MNLRPIAVLSAGVVLLASMGLVVPAQASTLALSPVVGNGFKTTVQSQFGVTLSHPSSLATSATLQLGARVQDPSGGLDAVDGAQLVMPSGIRYGLPGGQTRSNSFAIAPKTIHPGGLISSDLQLTIEGSPYKFESRLEIASSADLTVDAGVVLDFSASTNGGIWAHGNVFMNGTLENPILVGYAKRWETLFSTDGAQNNTFDLKGVQVFGGASGSPFGSVQNTTVLIENSEFYDFQRFGWFYPGSKLRIKRSVLSNAGPLDIWSSTGSLFEDNLFIYSNISPLAIRTSTLAITGNDFSKLENAPLRFYANADLTGNYWGTTNPALIANFILDGTNSLEYGSALADYSLPLAEPAELSPTGATFAQLASYLTTVVSAAQYPVLILTPNKERTDGFLVEVTPFVDAGDLNGLLSEGEQVGSPAVVEFVDITSVLSGLSFTASATYLGTSITGNLTLPEGPNYFQVDTSNLRIQRLSLQALVWEEFPVLFSRHSNGIFFGANVPAIEQNVHLRLLVGGSTAQVLTIFIQDNLETQINLSAPTRVNPGSSLFVGVQLKDANNLPVQISWSDAARLTYELNGPGLAMTGTRLTTNSLGQTSIWVLLGANDSGILEITVTLDPDGDLGSAPLIQQTISVLVASIGEAVIDSVSGETFLLRDGTKYPIPSSYPNLIGALQNPTLTPPSFLAEYDDGPEFAGLFRNAASGKYYFTDDLIAEELDDCFLAAQFDFFCSDALDLSAQTTSAFLSAIEADAIQPMAFASLGQMLTPTLEIQGTPAVGQNLSLRITGVQAGGYSSLRWLRLTTPEVVLRQDRVTYTVQPADLGQPIAVEMTVSIPRYESKTVRSDVVTAAQTATPITWAPAPGPAVIVPDLPVRPSPSAFVSPDATELDSSTAGDTDFRSWTKRLDTNSAKVYGKDLIGAGKVQYFLNGREIAWARADSEQDPKLLFANDSAYLVRTVFLEPGKNVIEIWLNGVRVTRVAYTL